MLDFIVIYIYEKFLTFPDMKKVLTSRETQIMGVINLTPDSYFSYSRVQNMQDFRQRVGEMIDEGADIIDLGGMSSRPGAKIISPTEEFNRVKNYFIELRNSFPKAFISIDTVHAKLAHFCLEHGANMINDISAGTIDPELLTVVSKYDAYYCLMHMKNRPENMQFSPQYQETTLDVLKFLTQQLSKLKKLGIHNVMVDPGFGFGKSIEDNYRLLKDLSVFSILDCPILVGLSRKSMIYKPLEIEAADSLAASSALHLTALQNGANILRVHDVKEARQVKKLFELLNN